MSMISKAGYERQNIFSGSDYEKTYSYSRAVKVGPQVFLSGTTGYDYSTDTLAAGAAAQTAQLMQNANNALVKAGGSLSDVVRVRMYIAEVDDYDAIMDIFAETFKGISPACTTVQAGLFDPEIKIEMDMDAIVEA
ncbi:Rid family hydrolase [Kordiimonas pumila]|uniref:Rid family hydrolase n=1 Tax=Kordiimonas pumila TaxID=2161677 RepID=A0ABV7D4G1_9PROT|nr:Rid family hydrolase [Kordiimonas pumila]